MGSSADRVAHLIISRSQRFQPNEVIGDSRQNREAYIEILLMRPSPMFVPQAISAAISRERSNGCLTAR